MDVWTVVLAGNPEDIRTRGQRFGGTHTREYAEADDRENCARSQAAE